MITMAENVPQASRRVARSGPDEKRREPTVLCAIILTQNGGHGATCALARPTRSPYASLPPSWRLASNRNQVRRSVSSMKTSSRLAVPESS